MHRWKGNMKMELGEVLCKGVHWIELYGGVGYSAALL